MSSAIEQEFETVDLILKSDARTKNVDAFCLTWIKFERQLRKLTGNILYQASAFLASDGAAKDTMRVALLAKNNIKHDHFIGGIRRLTGHTMKDIIGERHKDLRKSVNQAYVFRNKIIHGQQTGHKLDGSLLAASQSDLREWCETVAKEGMERFGYDGFGRDSLRKTNRADITASVDKAIKNEGWEVFVKSL